MRLEWNAAYPLRKSAGYLRKKSPVGMAFSTIPTGLLGCSAGIMLLFPAYAECGWPAVQSYQPAAHAFLSDIPATLRNPCSGHATRCIPARPYAPNSHSHGILPFPSTHSALSQAARRWQSLICCCSLRD